MLSPHLSQLLTKPLRSVTPAAARAFTDLRSCSGPCGLGSFCASLSERPPISVPPAGSFQRHGDGTSSLFGCALDWPSGGSEWRGSLSQQALSPSVQCRGGWWGQRPSPGARGAGPGTGELSSWQRRQGPAVPPSPSRPGRRLSAQGGGRRSFPCCPGASRAAAARAGRAGKALRGPGRCSGCTLQARLVSVAPLQPDDLRGESRPCSSPGTLRPQPAGPVGRRRVWRPRGTPALPVPAAQGPRQPRVNPPPCLRLR